MRKTGDGARKRPAASKPSRVKTPAAETGPTGLYQLKVTLLHYKPPIWRRVLVPAGITLKKLHHILQDAMGWTNSHLHEFKAGGIDYSDPEFELEHAENEGKVRLDQIAPQKGSRFGYMYDFGDSWDHQVTVEEILPPPEVPLRNPVCLAGARACPPEDCGDYDYFLEVINDPRHEEHENLLEWIGGSFDPERFDIDEVNAFLKEIRL